MRLGRTSRSIVVVAGAAVVALLMAGPASACRAPASAEVACSPDLAHWQAVVTVANLAPSALTLTSSSLDTTAWSSSARLSGQVAGTVVLPGATVTGWATGLPLSTAGAVVTYAMRYADGTAESNALTLARPFPQCDQSTTTSLPTTVATTVPATTVPATTVATTVAPATETSAAATTVSVPGSVVASSPATRPADVLGTEETAASSVPTLARTGAGGAGQLAFGALLLVLAGVGLLTVALLGTPTRRQHR